MRACSPRKSGHQMLLSACLCTGLGLALSRHFCRMMGGEVSLISELGEGTTFTVRLPLAVTLPSIGSEVESNKKASVHDR